MKDLVAQFALNKRVVHDLVGADMMLGYTKAEISHGRLDITDETGPLKELHRIFSDGDIVITEDDEDFDG